MATLKKAVLLLKKFLPKTFVVENVQLLSKTPIFFALENLILLILIGKSGFYRKLLFLCRLKSFFVGKKSIDARFSIQEHSPSDFQIQIFVDRNFSLEKLRCHFLIRNFWAIQRRLIKGKPWLIFIEMLSSLRNMMRCNWDILFDVAGKYFEDSTAMT